MTRTRLAAIAVLAMTAALFFTRLGERSLWSEEVRWAEIPREMQRSGDFFRPTFNGRLYYDKPLGSYWLVLAAAHVTGGIDELSARLPSAISAWIAVVLLMLIARRLDDGETGVLAGAILATSFGFTGFARTASADAETVAGVLAALWLFVRNEGRAGRWLNLFWIVMALTSLTKGLLGFALPLLVGSVYSTWAGLADSESKENWRRRVFAANGWLLNPITLFAAPLAAAVYIATFLLSEGGAIEGLKMVFRENIRRFYDPVNHRGPIYLYAYVIFELMAPWAVLLPAALLGAMPTALGGHGSNSPSTRKRVPRPKAVGIAPSEDRFALAYFWCTFLFFTLSASRRSYYLLPVLPAAALLIASVLASRRGTQRNWVAKRPEFEFKESPGRSRFRLAGIIVFALGVLVAPAALLPPTFRPSPLDQLPALPAPGAFIGAWVVSIAALTVAAIRPLRVAAALVVTAFAFQGYLFVFALPAVDALRTQRPFAAAARDRVASELPRLGLYRTEDIVYYLDAIGPLPEFDDPAKLRRAVTAHEIRWILVRRRDRDEIGAGWVEVIAEPVNPWDGPDQSKSKLLLLRAAE